MKNETRNWSGQATRSRPLDRGNYFYPPVEFDQEFDEHHQEYNPSPYPTNSSLEISWYGFADLDSERSLELSGKNKRNKGRSRYWEYDFNNLQYPDRNPDRGKGVSAVESKNKDRSYFGANMAEQERWYMHHDKAHNNRRKYYLKDHSYTSMNQLSEFDVIY